jgi:hypothetical protein
MKGLAKFLVETILGEAAKIDKVVVVYSGRFQPFHKGHYATYDHLVKKFGKDNVYIGTSNVTDSKKSPFNFKEKKAIMMKMFGVPSNKIVNIRNPYAPEEILNKFDEDTTGFITVVGEKDSSRLSGKYFTPYKGKVEQGYLDKGYVYAAPAQPNAISGTDVRYWLSAGTTEDRKKGFMKAYPKFDDQIFKLITLKLKSLKEYINEEIKLNVKVGDQILMGKFKNKKVIVKSIGKDEWGMPTINGKKVVTFRIPKKENLKEATGGSGGFTAGDEPDMSFVADGQKRILNKAKPENWYKQGGYVQLEEPTADAMRGRGKTKDKESQFRKAIYKVQNVVQSTLNPADDPHTVENWQEVNREVPLEKPKRFWELPKNQKPQIISKEDINEIIDEMEQSLLDEMGLPGGAGVGLSLAGGYINGAPNPKDVKKLKSKLDKDGSEEYTKVKEVINTKNHKPVKKGGADDRFNHHHKTSTYAPDYGHSAELDTIDFDDDREKEVGHQTNTKDKQNKGYEPVKEDNVLKGGKADGMTLKDIAKHHNVDVQTIKNEFIKGYAIEREHTKDSNIAKEIALDHLYEHPSYYTRLAVVDERNINETTANGAFYNDGNTTTGYIWNSDWDDFENQDYYLDGLEGWELFDDSPAEREIKSSKDQTLPLHNHSDDKTSKYSRIAKLGLKAPADFLKEELILEGGAYGHMAHPFDIEMGLTFGDLKQIVVRALNGDLELAREKTDGQALAVSWVNGRLVAARNKSHLKNKGEGAMTIGQVADKFAGRGGLTDAYNFAMKDLSMAISQLSEPQRKMIFKGGSCFMNLEVIYPTSVNVIPYGQPLLVFHGTFEYDKEGNIIGENQQAAKVLAGMIKQVNAHVQSKYTIQGPPIQKLPKSEHLSKLQGKYISMINKLQSEFGLSDSDGVADYHQAWWTDFVEKKAKKLDTQEKIGLVKRWAFGDKSFRINTIQDAKLRAWAEQTDKQDQQKISKQNLMRFEEIFLGVGADVLSFMSSVLTANPDSAKKQMVSRLESTIQQVKASGDPKKIQKLKLELQRLNALGGFEKIVPNEGIVFIYGGNTYKLTGAFAPLNQILGIFFEK